MTTEVMESSLWHYLSVFENPPSRPLSHRACYECRRKKTKCNMRRPSCSLCERIGATCAYPTTRKSNRRPRDNILRKQSIPGHEINKPQEDAMTYSWETFLNSGYSSDGNSNQTSQESPHIPMAQAPSTLALSCSTNSRQVVPEVNISDSTTAPDREDRHDLSDSILSIPGVELGEEISPELFTGFTIPFDPHLSITGDTGDWFSGKQPDAHIVIPSYINAPPVSPTCPGQHVQTSLASLSADGSVSSSPSLGQQLPPNALSSLSISTAIANELIELFFERVQLFCPLLHRPKFVSEFYDASRSSEECYKDLDMETVMLLNAMFSLSARFSTKSYTSIAAKKSASQFAERAGAIYDHLIKSNVRPSLRFLQALILISYYDLTSKPSFQAWLSTGLCCRIAYSLCLHQTDQGSEGEDQTTDWVELEEKRRAWWVIYQMDNFASIIGSRPFDIDSSRMNVFLPVPDSDWFANRPIQSAPLPQQGHLWRTLIDCENQSPYAWFIICNGLLRATYQEIHKPSRSVNDLKIFQSVLYCFGLALPPVFRSLHGNFLTSDQDFADKNWIICTQILLQNARILIAIALETVQTSPPKAIGDRRLPETVSSIVAPTKDSLLYEKLFDICGQQINEHLRSVKLWSPDSIILASPLITCALIGVAAVCTTKPSNNGDEPSVTTLRLLEWQILDLALSRFAEYWDLGKDMRDLLKCLIESPAQAGFVAMSENTWIKGLLPDFLKFIK